MKTRNSHGLLQLGRESLAYCQCLYRENKALFVSGDLIWEKNQVILEYCLTPYQRLNISGDYFFYNYEGKFGFFPTSDDSLKQWNCIHLLELSPPNFNDINRTISWHGLWIVMWIRIGTNLTDLLFILRERLNVVHSHSKRLDKYFHQNFRGDIHRRPSQNNSQFVRFGRWFTRGDFYSEICKSPVNYWPDLADVVSCRTNKEVLRYYRHLLLWFLRAKPFQE